MNKETLEQRLSKFEKQQYLVSALCLFIFFGLSIFFNKLHLQSVAAGNTKFLSRMIKIGDFREVTLILQEARLSSFTKIHYQSVQPDKSFILPPKAEIIRHQNMWASFSRDSITVPVIHSLSIEEQPDKIVFEYDRFRLVPYAILFWFILNIVSIPQTRYIRRRLVEQFQRDTIKEETGEKLKDELSNWMSLCEEKDLVCRQIYHDIASPLGLLKISTHRLGDQAIAKPFALSLDRLIKISEDLQSQKYIWTSDNPKLEPLKKTLEDILQEKRLLTTQMKIKYHLQADAKTLSQTPDIPIGQFHRVLSNILNNAIEAIQPKGEIKVIARHTIGNGKIDLIITDSGNGITKENAEHIFDKQKSFNKPKGSGLGLYHAKLCIESFGGELRLLRTNTKRNHGATFLIRLPLAK